MRLLQIKKQLGFVSLLILLFVVACTSPAEPTAVPAVEVVSAADIVSTVLAEIQPELSQLRDEEEDLTGDLTENQGAIDVEAITETVIARVKDRFDALEAAATNTKLPANTTLLANMTLPAASQELEGALIALYQRVNPAVVTIIVGSDGLGSGFVYDDAGHIVTNNHVAGSQRTFEVVFAGGERLQAQLVGRDVDSDLAVIKVEELPDGVTPLPLASSGEESSTAVQVGQFVIAIGNPFGEQGSMSLGIVSGLGRSLPSQRQSTAGSTYSLPEVIQTDAPINPGNSGGPLLNLDGEVVGVNSAIASTTGTNSGVGFSIPVAAVARIVPALISDGVYTYPYLGAAFDEEVSLDEQRSYGLSQTQGAYVVNITAGGPAAQAGLIAANAANGRGGDLIIAIDGRPVDNFSDLNSYLVFETAAGQSIRLTLLRNGQQIELPLTLGVRPQ